MDVFFMTPSFLLDYMHARRRMSNEMQQLLVASAASFDPASSSIDRRRNILSDVDVAMKLKARLSLIHI